MSDSGPERLETARNRELAGVEYYAGKRIELKSVHLTKTLKLKKRSTSVQEVPNVMGSDA